MKKIIVATIGLALVLGLINCSQSATKTNYHSLFSDNLETPAIGTVPDRISLDQGWDNETRMKFWFTSQGSQILPYSWFVHLEQSDTTSYFRDSEHMESMRYLPSQSSALNPGGLPIGFTITSNNQKDEDQWLGMTCAACHTNQMDYNGRQLIIDGGPTLANFVLFLSELIDAMNATNGDNDKFDRFAQNVLGTDNTSDVSDQLRRDLLKVTQDLAERQLVNALPDNYPADFTSYARLDAFGNIQNAGTAFALHDLANRNPPVAPVSYPFLWGTHQSDVVQWDASAPNTSIVGPLTRNIGEVVGVFGKLSIDKVSGIKKILGEEHRYSSTINFNNLGLLEDWVRDLRSPAWPQKYFPPIDAVKAAEGHLLFQQHCESCHQVIPRSNEGYRYISVKTPVKELRTDPYTAWNAQNYTAKSLILEGSKNKILAGPTFEETTTALDIPINGVLGLIIDNPIEAISAGAVEVDGKAEKLTKNQIVEQHINTHDSMILVQKRALEFQARSDTTIDVNGLVYKARPLNGIWATAPFSHNGSIPNLWQLLQDPMDRQKSFWVGSREFDPIQVGYITDEGLSEFHVENEQGEIQKGNSNLGHIYGTILTDDQKWKLIEYMKTL